MDDDAIFEGVVCLLQYHSPRRGGSFQCSICGQNYASKRNLTRHMDAHAGKYPHVCTVCGKGTTNPTYLKEHMTLHTGMNYFKCDSCGKTFRIKRTLQKHQATMHGSTA